MAEDTKSSRIYEELKNEISRGTYPPAFALTESELAGRFNVSRNTIKKALLMLESDGLVTMENNKSARIPGIPRSQGRARKLHNKECHQEHHRSADRQAVGAS